jgi:hypothetical protein
MLHSAGRGRTGVFKPQDSRDKEFVQVGEGTQNSISGKWKNNEIHHIPMEKPH